ncbi:MAG: alpha-L-fucosidase [Opitutaceae bacterium]|nr:alpha-L-fucosidase [Opitutaceae bacterium]
MGACFAISLAAQVPAPGGPPAEPEVEPPEGPPRVTLDLPHGAHPVPPGPVAADWDSIGKFAQTPAWLQDAKLGIFVFWGLFNVPDHGSDWYPRKMYSHEEDAAWHAAHFGAQDKFGYKDFIPKFTAKRYDPAGLADLFARVGAGYVVGLAEFRDGFALYDSQYTTWDAVDMGPRRDLLGELATATRARGMKFGVSYMRMAHWTFMFPRLVRMPHDLFDPAHAEFYGPPQRPKTPVSAAFQEEWLVRLQEIIDKYQPDTLSFDGTLNERALDPLKARAAAYFFNRAAGAGREPALFTMIGEAGPAFPSGGLREFERQGRAPKDLTSDVWQVTDPLMERFGYISGNKTATAGTMVRRLVENTCRNGTFLLVVSPRADGSLPYEQRLTLNAIAGWMDVNGEAIRGTRPWTIPGEGALVLGQGQNYGGRDIRFTRRGDTLYAILMDWPGSEAVVTSLASGATPGTVNRVWLLGHSAPLEFTQDASGLKVKLPEEAPCAHAYTLKIHGLKLQ